MELLNVKFVILLVKIVVCVMPGVMGIAFLVMSEEGKRELRARFCRAMFGVSNAIPFGKFIRGVTICSIAAILFSLAVGWFLLLRPIF